MPCPFFYPVARFETSSWIIAPRLPLGDAYAGECRASDETFQPDETRARETCNVGYGRECCDRFPQDAASDAVRFHVAGEAGELIRIQYVFEKTCWPQNHGTLEYSSSSSEFSGGSGDAVLQRQAAAFVESYLRRRE
jgi:hypothetical protein